MSKKVLNHPDKDEIIRKLTDGESIRSVVSWLEEKYPNSKSMRLTNPTLQTFRKTYLKLDGKVLQDIQEQRVVQKRAVDEQQKQAALEATSAYQDKINAIADTHLDVSNKILRLDAIIENRMEYWFNSIAQGEATPSQADKEMRQYMDRQMQLLQQYKKFVEGMADHTIEHTINIQIFNDQLSIFRDIIGEILTELEPEKAMMFMDLVNKRLNTASYDPEKKQPVDVELLDDLIQGDN